MAQKLIQTNSLQQVQTLSPQQVLQVRLLEMPIAELEQRVKNELMDNGALEEKISSSESDGDDSVSGQTDNEEDMSNEEPDFFNEDEPSGQLKQLLDDYRSEDDVPDYMTNGYNGSGSGRTMEYGDTTSFYEMMREQMNEAQLSEHEKQLMDYLIGSLEDDGMLKKDLSSLVDELEIYHNIKTNVSELTSVLEKIQTFDPPGVGARDLRECLMLQIKRESGFKTPIKQAELKVVERYFDDFTHKRWDRIAEKMKLSPTDVRTIQRELARLNPKPGSAMGEVEGHNFHQVVPDFIVSSDDEGHLELSLNNGDVPALRISPSYEELLEHAANRKDKPGRAEKEALVYTRQKIEQAQGFIDAINQRRHTLLAVMNDIMRRQYDFFEDGDEMRLKPMKLKDVAQSTGYDISTVSRVTNSKYVETRFGIYPLKWFFTDGMTTAAGEEIAVRQIKNRLKAMVEQEDKSKPLSDEALAEKLKGEGYPVARRTVAKYREQLGIPVARLRR